MAEQNEFGPDLLTLTDDEGVAHTFEKLDELEKDGHKYVAMIPAYDDDSLGQPGELIILRNEVEGDEEFLVGIESEEEFNDVAEITGVVLTKLDGTAKGGIAITIADEFDMPIKYIGVGEKMDDLKEFVPLEFAGGIFE